MEDFGSKKETPLTIESVQQAAADRTGLTGPMDRSNRSGRGSRVFKSPLLQVVGFESLESFSVFPSPSPYSKLGPRSPTQMNVRL